MASILGTAQPIGGPGHDVRHTGSDLVIAAGASISFQCPRSRNHARRVALPAGTDLDAVSAEDRVGTGVTGCLPLPAAVLISTGHLISLGNGHVRAHLRQNSLNSELSVPRKTS